LSFDSAPSEGVGPGSGCVLMCVGREESAFPSLGCRVVDLEDSDLAGQFRAVGERVEGGAEDHVLLEATADAAGEAVLGVAASAGDLYSGTG
jgi:hypothetical protein